MLLNSFPTSDTGTQARKKTVRNPRNCEAPPGKTCITSTVFTFTAAVNKIQTAQSAYLSVIPVGKVSFAINECLPFTVKLLLITCRQWRNQQQILSRFNVQNAVLQHDWIFFGMHCTKQRTVQWGSDLSSTVPLVTVNVFSSVTVLCHSTLQSRQSSF